MYRDVLKDKPVYNTKEFSVSADSLYDAALKAIYSKNFFVEKEEKANHFILAKRSFQRGRKTAIVLLQVKIVPNEPAGANLYLNAFQTTERSYVADRTRFFLWLIPLPGGGGKEATSIKETETVIEDKDFYDSLFSCIESQLQAGKRAPDTAIKQVVDKANQQVPDTAGKQDLDTVSQQAADTANKQVPDNVTAGGENATQ